MRLFRNIQTATRIQLIINIVFTILFIIGTLFYYFEKRYRLLKENQLIIDRDISELIEFVDNHLRKDRDLLNLSVNIADFKINEYSDIEQFDDKLTFRAVDPYSNNPLDIEINRWTVDGVDFVDNYHVVDEIKKISKSDVSIYQKCEKGYVNVSTSSVNTAGDRMTGDIILSSSAISKTIESGNQYTGRFHGKSAWFTISYKPVYIGGKVQGLYYVGIRERMGTALKRIFENRKYFESGYPFIISENGELLVHPTKQGEDYSGTILFKNIIKQGKGFNTFQYKWPETGEGTEWLLHYKYHENSQSYVCIAFPVKELFRNLNLSVLFALAGYLIFIILMQFVISVSMRSLKSKLKNLRQMLNKLSKGENVSEIKLEGEKEFIEIAERISELSKRYGILSSFAQGLANDNYSQTYPKSFINDEIGESLIKINDKLNEAMYNEHIRQKEEKLRTWESEGLSKFVNILQRNRDKLDELCYELISNLVEYLNANLGALFFLNNEDPNDVYFMQMATYAFEQKKILTKKIYPEQGLIGRVYNEKQTIYLTELPEDYISITSGLGEGIPKNLLIVPLLINKEVYGVIEIASFNVLKGYQIEFLEKIGENIASTINNVLVNNKTRELLEQSRAQSELLSVQEEKMRKNLQELKNIQKETESGIYEMRDVFKTIEELMLMVKLSVSGEIISLNHKVADFFSIEKQNLIGRHYNEYSYFIPLDEYKLLIKGWEKVMSGNSAQIELKVKPGAGQMKHILLNMIPELEKGKTISIILIGMEISEKRT